MPEQIRIREISPISTVAQNKLEKMKDWGYTSIYYLYNEKVCMLMMFCSETNNTQIDFAFTFLPMAS